MPLDKVVLLPVWAEVPYLFDPQYRAALAWAEEVTRVSEMHASDEAYAAAAAAFEPRDLVDLTIALAAMNAFTRLVAPFRLPVKTKARVIRSELHSGGEECVMTDIIMRLPAHSTRTREILC